MPEPAPRSSVAPRLAWLRARLVRLPVLVGAGVVIVLFAVLTPLTLHAAEPPPLLDLNSATVDELSKLPGIGAKKAQAIVTQRQRRPFRRTAELLKIRGIGPKMYARLKPLVKVETSAP